MTSTGRVLAGLLTIAVAGVGAVADERRALSFDDRVAAQEAIERVYLSHRTGTRTAFEDVVRRESLERTVTDYLRRSAALEAVWHTPVTTAMLQSELERMARGTRMPERLEALFAALDHDPVLIRECLARPVLVRRLTREFYAFDPRLHAETRAAADALLRSLDDGTLDPWQVDPRRTELELVRAPGHGLGESGRTGPSPNEGQTGTVNRVELSSHRFDRWRRDGRDTPTRIVEGRDAFQIRVVLEDNDSWLRAAVYRVEKTPWASWWNELAATLDEVSVDPVAPIDSGLPEIRDGHDAAWDPARSRTEAGRGRTSTTAGDTWDNGALDDVPDPREGHTAVWTGSVMIVWGGYHDGTYFDTGWRYDPATDTWDTMTIADAPSPRLNHTAVWTGSEMVVWGGSRFESGIGTVYPGQGGRYDPVADQWLAVADAGSPSARAYHTAVWTGSRMVVWGGFDGAHANTGGLYDPAGDTWTDTATDGAPAPRSDHVAVWVGDSMVVWGGRSFDGSTIYFDTGGRYDPATDSWTPMATSGAPSPRTDLDAVWTGTSVLVWGGYDGTYLNTGGRYDPAADSWSPTTTAAAPPARAYHTAVWDGTRMIVWGGNNSDGGIAYFADGGRYDPVADTWSPTDSAGAPTARRFHTAVWTGDLMLVWGGRATGVYFDSGGRYDPTTDTWTPTGRNGAPESRTDHTAVWTGDLMVVWGGFGYEGYFDTGGRYDPATDSWAPTALLDAPSPRRFHTAVWTGSHMVVWGGSEATYLDTGGRYDPGADTWEPTTTADAPEARNLHSAVWTGDRMIVWGGYDNTDGATYFDTGGSYDPATDTWSPTGTVGAPSPRANHSAVWTGSLMIVWGGGGGSNLDTGGRYDPATDAWAPTETFRAPSARTHHQAVWTGTEMIVWAGWGGGLQNTGGRYDPATNAWVATSTVDAPSPRQDSVAIWTGGLMVVWGGGAATKTDTGGRYDPATDTWLPTSTIGAPTPRSDHTAVWTGDFMMVWGGEGDGYRGTGGRYVVDSATDTDGDGRDDDEDCMPQDETLWSAPSAPVDLLLSAAATGNLTWSEPSNPGGTAPLRYDVLVSETADDWSLPETICVESDGGDLLATDVAEPLPGHGLYYLVRAENDCGDNMGESSSGVARAGRTCP